MKETEFPTVTWKMSSGITERAQTAEAGLIQNQLVHFLLWKILADGDAFLMPYKVRSFWQKIWEP